MADQTRSSSDAPDSPLAAGWGFWLWWVLAGTLGWGVGGPVGAALGRAGGIIVAGYVGVAVGGIVAGGLQSLVLRRQVPQAGWWVLTTIVAVAVVGVVVFGVGVVNADVGWVVGASLFGPVVGVLQWRVLRRQVARAGWWVLASTVGWVVGMAGGAVTGWPLLGGWAGLGAGFVAITGSVLPWLLRHRLTPQPAAVSV